MAAKHAAKAEHHRKRAAHLGPERRRPDVLDAALELFLEHGYDGTSMQAVADRAEVTKPVVYDCFPGKDELFRALLAREEERILAEIQSAFQNADLRVEKALRVGSGQQAAIVFDLFNALNSDNYGCYETTIIPTVDQPNDAGWRARFGRPTCAGLGRRLQLGMRYGYRSADR